jgi:hypothetical protein
MKKTQVESIRAVNERTRKCESGGCVIDEARHTDRPTCNETSSRDRLMPLRAGAEIIDNAGEHKILSGRGLKPKNCI